MRGGGDICSGRPDGERHRGSAATVTPRTPVRQPPDRGLVWRAEMGQTSGHRLACNRSRDTRPTRPAPRRPPVHHHAPGGNVTEHLPPHDPLRRCVKCETLTIASTQYRPRRPHLTWNGDTIEEIVTHGPSGGDECLLRTCLDCGWAWLETCADAGAPQTITTNPVMRGHDATGP